MSAIIVINNVPYLKLKIIVPFWLQKDFILMKKLSHSWRSSVLMNPLLFSIGLESLRCVGKNQISDCLGQCNFLNVHFQICGEYRYPSVPVHRYRWFKFRYVILCRPFYWHSKCQTEMLTFLLAIIICNRKLMARRCNLGQIILCNIRCKQKLFIYIYSDIILKIRYFTFFACWNWQSHIS